MGDGNSLEVNLMKEEVCNVNSKISVDCLKRRYPEIDIQKGIVDEMNRKYNFYIKVPGTDSYEPLAVSHLSDKKRWGSNFMYDKFYLGIITATGNPGLGFGMGREFFLDNDMMNFLGPIISVKGILEHMPETMAKWNRTKKGIVMINEPGHFKFAIRHHPGIIVSDFAVDYHLGIFDGVAEVCGLVGFETKLIKREDENRYLEFEGKYEFENRPTRMFNHYIVKSLPHVKRILEIERTKTINSREASIRERVQKEKEERKNKNLQKFVSERVIDQCASDKGPERGLERTHRSIMFCDMRDYTGLSERVDENLLEGVMNRYFEAMMRPIYENKGEVDKIMGDNIMAYFKTADDAVSAAIKMRFELENLNREIKSQNIPNLDSLRNGIGISTGKTKLGNVGSNEKMSETVTGDIVNVGSRLEQLTKEYHAPVIIDESTYRGVEGKVLARELDFVCLKGKQNKVRIYEVIVPEIS